MLEVVRVRGSFFLPSEGCRVSVLVTVVHAHRGRHDIAWHSVACRKRNGVRRPGFARSVSLNGVLCIAKQRVGKPMYVCMHVCR